MAVNEQIQKRRAYDGPVIFERGFRPFFFLAGLWSIIALVPWVLYYSGLWTPASDINLMQWHGHEMLFGYASAAVFGFALTAIPNWTGRLPVLGLPLAGLTMSWVLVRILALISLMDPYYLTIQMWWEAITFAAFALLIIREITAGKNWRNLPIAIMVTLFGIGAFFSNLTRLEAFVSDINFLHLGIAVLIMLISLIGGRIVPSFTTNWLKQQGLSQRAVNPMQRFDQLTLAVSLIALVLWLHDPYFGATLALTAIAALMHFIRLSRWQGMHTAREPIVFMLHASYAWIGLGFAAASLAAYGLIDIATALHAWTAGAIGGMTLSVMMRATLGHSGKAIKADKIMTGVFIFVQLAAILRLAAGFSDDPIIWVQISSVFWALAFVLYLWRFTPLFWRK